jgi:hypothetical protein
MMVNDVLEHIRKEAGRQYYFEVYLERWKKSTKNLRIAGVAAEILTQHLLNIC